MSANRSLSFFWYRIGAPVVAALFGFVIVIRAVVLPSGPHGAASLPVLLSGIFLIILATAVLLFLRQRFMKRDGRWF